MSKTPNIDEIYFEIHFTEDSIPGIRAGKLTDKSKAQLTTILKDIIEPEQPINVMVKMEHAAQLERAREYGFEV